jgi:hypothetical protein
VNFTPKTTGAPDFRTWQTLVRREELDDRTAVALMVRLATAVGKG